jgi:hypothetical protein
MEPLRPKVDRLLLDWVLSQRFMPKDFFETRDGICKVSTGITKQIIPLVKGLQKDVAVVVREFTGNFKNKSSIQKPEYFSAGIVKPVTIPSGTKAVDLNPAEILQVTEVKEISCLECGKVVIPKSSRQKFCCDRHKDTYHKRLRRETRLRSSSCPQCGGSMPEAAAGTYKERLTYCPACVEYYRRRYRMGKGNREMADKGRAMAGRMADSKQQAGLERSRQ